MVKGRANRPLESQAYGAGTKGRSLDKHMRWFHNNKGFDPKYVYYEWDEILGGRDII
jgi:hypothetical protein